MTDPISKRRLRLWIRLLRVTRVTEAQLREFLRGELGNEWFAKRDAGDLLRELWSLGQGPSADDLLKDVTGARLEMAAVADRVREGLGA